MRIALTLHFLNGRDYLVFDVFCVKNHAVVGRTVHPLPHFINAFYRIHFVPFKIGKNKVVFLLRQTNNEDFQWPDFIIFFRSRHSTFWIFHSCSQKNKKDKLAYPSSRHIKRNNTKSQGEVNPSTYFAIVVFCTQNRYNSNEATVSAPFCLFKQKQSEALTKFVTKMYRNTLREQIS